VTAAARGSLARGARIRKEILLADHVVRTEQGCRSTPPTRQICAPRSFYEEPISGIKNLRWFVECNRDDVAFYDLEANVHDVNRA
jgi:hypothetical protein